MVFVTLMSLYSPHNWAYVKRDLNESQAYKDFAKCLVESIYKFHNNCVVEFKAINFKEGDYKELLALNQNINFHKINKDFSNKSQEYYKGFLMYNRTLFIEEMLKKYKQPILYLDTDCMLRGEVSFIENKLDEGFDMMVLTRPKQPPKTKFNAGVIALNYNSKVMNLIRLWKKCMGENLENISIKNSKGRSSSREQVCLWSSYNKSDVLLHPLPQKFNDGDLRKGSIIWHGHSGDKKVALNKFLNEVKKI